jgi:Holliday junction resolvase RusA-like endonuclease
MATKAHDALGEFAALFQQCWICASNQRLVIHHICGRRGKNPHDRRNLFRACDTCHRIFHDGGGDYEVTAANILWCKRDRDPDYYDPEFLASLRGKKHLGYEPEAPAGLPKKAFVHDGRWMVLRIPGDPVPQPRPRVTRFGVYIPKEHPIHEYKQVIKAEALERGMLMAPKGTPVNLKIAARFERPKSHYTAKGELKPTAANYPLPDIDNVQKAVMDALTGVAYEDDKQVVSCLMGKSYGPSPDTYIRVIW